MSEPIAKIIVHPTDFTEVSHRAFRQALAIALQGEAVLIVVHVGPESSADVNWAAFPGVRATLAQWGLMQPGDSRSLIQSKFGIRVQKIVRRHRDPATATANLVDEYGADLVVVGTQHKGKLDFLLKPSVANAIRRKTSARTLFVPDRAVKGIIRRGDGDGVIRNILVPVDKLPDSCHAINEAQTIALALGEHPTSMKLFHVGKGGLPTAVPDNSHYCQWKHEIRSGDVGREIEREAQGFQADLIVMASSGQRGALEAMFASTSEYVVRHAHCPVLAVPA